MEVNGVKTYQDYVMEVCNPRLMTEEVIGALEKALEAVPKRKKDLLRVAKSLRNLCEITAGKAYIVELEKFVNTAG